MATDQNETSGSLTEINNTTSQYWERLEGSQTDTKRRQYILIWMFRDRVQSGLLKGASCQKEMEKISEKLSILEEFTNLEAETIYNTRICKVLEDMTKLETSGLEIFRIRERSEELLGKLNGFLYRSGTIGE